MNLRETECYKQMTPYHACELAEGFGDGESATEEERLIAWQYISDTGIWRNRQGYYGCNVHYMIEEELIERPQY